MNTDEAKQAPIGVNEEPRAYTTIHMCLSVRGALRNWSKRELATLFTHDDGRKMTASEARDALLDELAKDHEVIPLGPPCEGFDYEAGCPGHRQEPK